jgi:hypothetical protein
MSKLMADVQQSKENRLRPEYIEQFFLEAYRSFGGTITEGRRKEEGGRRKKDKVWSISRIPPDLRKLPEALERKYGKIGTQYPQLTFDKDQVVGYSDLEFVGPGHQRNPPGRRQRKTTRTGSPQPARGPGRSDEAKSPVLKR